MILGHQKQRFFLNKIAKSGKIPHSFLFSGQEGLGKKQVAIEFFSLIFKENLILHPDFVLIEPLKNGQIQIDQIRELSWKLSLKPIKANLKGAIIDNAHLMTQEAQNCLLKTLEEPKGNSLLILITHLPSLLFPTIVSRCQVIKFSPVKKEEIKNYLENQKLNRNDIEEILEMCQGRPAKAIEMISKKDFQFYKKTIKNLTTLSSLNLAGRFQYAKELSKRGDIKKILEIWLNYYRKNVFKNKKILQQIEKIFFLISTTNINQRLALELLFLEI
jgi:DNA polymerase-3 subunit delta'